MRNSNYISVPHNRASVAISTNLYDRRALDVTSDQPLVNSLNHLTFLTSSSAKVRETLANDGGLERLVDILYECTKEVGFNNILKKKTVQEEKISSLIAWKWTLAFQCLVLVGTRGTEQIRKRVVEAGVLPIIATVLDNYLLFVRNFDNETDSNLNQEFSTLISEHLRDLYRYDYGKKQDYNANDNDENDNKNKNKNENENDDDDDNDNNDNDNDNDDQKNVDEICNFLNKDSILFKYLHGKFQKKDSNIIKFCDITKENIKSNLQDINEKVPSPRIFINGILIPKDDDVVWSLQLLAFISKYSDLKHEIQSSQIANKLSLRSFINKTEKLEIDTLNIDQDIIPPYNDYDLISNVSSDDQSRYTQLLSQTSEILNGSSQTFHIEPSTQSNSGIIIPNNISNDNISNPKNLITSLHKLPSTESLSSKSSISLENKQGTIESSLTGSNSSLTNEKSSNINENLYPVKGTLKNISKSLLNSLFKCDQLTQFFPEKRQEQVLSLIELEYKLDYHLKIQRQEKLLNSIKKSKDERNELQKKWNYETYFLDQSNHDTLTDYDLDELITHKLNVFPLVEKFTIHSLNTPDMSYWAGVIMRNSCRKDEKRGGVRQCAFFKCGKWESFPREFAKCRRCKRTKYCSKECQLNAWVYHKHWCVDSNNAASSNINSHGSNTRALENVTTDTGNVTEVNTATASTIISRDEVVRDTLDTL